MKNFKKILVLMILVFASVLSFTACGNPYKDLKLIVDDGGFEDAFDREFLFHGQGHDESNTFAINVSVIGAKKKVSTDVVFTVQDKGVVDEVADSRVVDGNETTATFLLKDVGETYITVSTVEGNLSKNIKITSYATANGLEFSKIEDSTGTGKDPIIFVGETVDVGRVMPGFKKPLITFTPSYANRRNVTLSVKETNYMVNSISITTGIFIDGNNITVGKDFEHSAFTLTATLTNSEGDTISREQQILVRKPLTESNLTLAYTSFSGDKDGTAKLNKLDYDAENNIYTMYLADQLSGDVGREAKNIYLATEKENGGTLVLNREGGEASEFSFLLSNKDGTNTTSFVNTIGKTKSFAITNGTGIGNYDTYTFNVNYQGYENFYSGITMAVKVVVESFPTGVVVNSSINKTNIDAEEGSKFYVFNSYYQMMGTQIYVKLINNGGFISGQYAYVGIKKYDDVDMTWKDAPLGAFSIYDSNGKLITPGLTRVLSGDPVYVRFDSTVVTDLESKYVFYAYSSSDKNISSLKVDERGQIADYEEQTAKLVLIKDYSFDYASGGTLYSLQDIIIEVGSGAKDEQQLNLNTVDGKIPYNKFEVTVGNLAVLISNDEGYFVTTKNGEFGQTYYTVVAPNGFTVSRTISITPRVTEFTEFNLKVNNYVGTEMSLDINILTKLSLSLMIDGVEYKELPPTFNMTIQRDNASGYCCAFDGWQNIRSLSTPTPPDGPLDKFVIYLYVNNETQPKQNFRLSIRVIKPIRSITASNAYVDIVSNDIVPITDQSIDSSVKKDGTNIISGGYLDISNKSSAKISYHLNPEDASIGVVSFNNKNYLDLIKSSFSFVYENESFNLTEVYGKNGNGYGSYVEYDGGFYAYELGIEEGQNNNTGEDPGKWYKYTNNHLSDYNILPSETNDDKYLISKLYEAKKTFVYSVTRASGNSVKISFDWEAYIDSEVNRIVIDITNVEIEITGGNTNSGGEFEIRFTYTQTYNVSPDKIYYLKHRDAGADPNLNDSYYFTDSIEEGAPEITYINAYRVDASCIQYNSDKMPISVLIGGIYFALYSNGGGYSFNYDQYALQMSCSTRFSVKKPIKTDSITMVGMSKDDSKNVYTIDLNKNQIATDKTYSYSYITKPLASSLEKYGVILGVRVGSSIMLKERYNGLDKTISTLDFDENKKLIGVKSTDEWKDISGLSFYINTITQKIDFKVSNLDNFTEYIGSGYYCEFVLASLDSVCGTSRDIKYVTIRINLRTGTQDNPYAIYDATSFQNVALDMGIDTWYEVTNDISLKGITGWKILGDYNNPFKANIKTKGDQKFSIFGFNAATSPAYDDNNGERQCKKYIGLFGYIDGGCIENLTFRDINFRVNLDNLYGESELYVGLLAGFINNGTFKNIRIEDDEFAGYENYKYLNNLATGNYGRGLYFLNTGNQHTTNLSVYIGAFAGKVVGNSDCSISNLQVYYTIQVNDDRTEHTYCLGGAIGEIGSSGNNGKTRIFSGDSKVYSVIHSNVVNEDSATGGVVGKLSGKIYLYDVVSISYIYAVGGYNIGGVIGMDASSGNVNNISSTPMIYATGKSQNIGGVTGYVYKADNENNKEYKNIKVKFVDRNADNSIFNTSITGYANIGGIAGKVIGTNDKLVTISNASVFSYVSNKDINGINYVDLDYAQKTDVDGKFYGDIVAYGNGESNVAVGGFIGVGSGTIEVSNAYLNSQIRIITNDTYLVGGIFGQQGGKYHIENTTLTGNIFYDKNGYEESEELDKKNYIGNFIGKFTSRNINEDVYKKIQGGEALSKDDFNIVDSYSIMQSQDSSLTQIGYIKNFTGNADISTNTDVNDTKYMTLSFSYVGKDSSERDVKTISVTATTVDGLKVEYKDLFKKAESESEMFTKAEDRDEWSASITLTNIPTNFSIEKQDSNGLVTIEDCPKTASTGKATIKFKTNTNILDSKESIDLGSIVFKVPAYTQTSNVLAFNSFYFGYQTSVYFDETGTVGNYEFNYADFKESASVKGSNIDVVKVGDNYFNYFSNFGYDNLNKQEYDVVVSKTNSEKSNIVFENFLDATNLGFTGDDNFKDLTVEKFTPITNATKSLHSIKNSNTTYIYTGEDGGYLNGKNDDINEFAMYQNRELLDGNVIALIEGAKTKNGKPNLVVDIAPNDMNIVVQNLYTASDTQLVAIVMVSDDEDNPTTIDIVKNNVFDPYLLQIDVLPVLASDEVVFASSDESVFKINSQNKLVVVNEGVGILKVTSKLNAKCEKEVVVIAVRIDRNGLEWQIQDANSSKYYSDYDINGNLLIDIIANDGTTLTTSLNSKGSLTYGVEYKVNFNTVTAVSEDKKIELLKNLTIGGQKIPTSQIDSWVASNKTSNFEYTFDCSGLQHAIFGSVLGSVVVEQKLYFHYQIGETILKCYINTSGGTSVQSKNLMLNFKEGVFGIAGSNELSFVVVNRENFVIALNCDSENFDLFLKVTLNDVTINIDGVTIGEEIRFADYGLGQLIIRLESITYEENKKLKTFKFSAYLNDEGQKNVNSDENYTFEIMPLLNDKVYEDEHLIHNMDITISQQQVENINLTHYTNMLYSTNESMPINGDSYKYQSGIIIPGYTSLLHIDFYPSFGFYDYIEVVCDNDKVSLGQVVEVLNMDGKSVEYSWYEPYSEHVNLIQRGIRISNRYSTKDYGSGSVNQFGYNGSLFIAINVDTSLADKNITITVNGYKNDVATPLFTQSTKLEVEARPQINVKSNVTEIVFGGKVPLDIDIRYTSESFSASLKSSLSDAELLGSLASVIYDPEYRQYVLYVNDTRYAYINYSHLMYQNLVLSLTVNKLINGVVVSSTANINVRLVPFIVEGINLNIEGSRADNKNYIVSYYQSYNVSISVDASYSQGYFNYLLALDPNTAIVTQIANLERLIAKNIANYSILSQGGEANRKSLLDSTNYVYSGEFALTFDASSLVTSIRFISSAVTGFIWAEIGLEYTDDGIELVQTFLNPSYIFSDYVSVSIDTSSADDHPEPITSVNDLLNMKEGVSYILLKDLVLLNWSPLDVNFKMFDGNGYTLTVMSFAKIEKASGETTNVGIFKSIPANTVVKNVTIEVTPYNGYTNSDEEYANGEFAGNLTAKLIKDEASLDKYLNNGITIDITQFENVNFGLLAGENLGIVTNCKVVNNAVEYRTARENALNKKVNDSLRINVNYGDDFSNVLRKFESNNSNRKITINTVLGDETKAKNDNIGLLIGSNSGYLTNSSVSKIDITSQEYIGGLVGYNMGTGKISSCFVREINIDHNVVVKVNSGVGGLVARNSGEIAYSYVTGKFIKMDNLEYPKDSNLRAQGSSIKTNSYGGGFVYSNYGVISNCYSNIVLTGSVAGFAYKNEEIESVIEYCYSLSSVKLNDINTYPFVNKFMSGSSKLINGTVIDCFYLYDAGYSNMANDAGTSLNPGNFKDYNAFVAYAFNSDYTNNAEVLDAVWYIPDENNNFGQLLSSELQGQFNSYVDGAILAPQLVSADAFTLSVRYLIQSRTDEYAFTYNYATELGSFTNPILLNDAETYNKSIVSNETRHFRLISDISFNVSDEVSKTYNTTFRGKLDGNNMTFKSLRLNSNTVDTSQEIKKLGMFNTISGRRTLTGLLEYAVVKNVNIEVAQLDGINVNVVGVLAGEVSNARIYNVNVSGESVIVQGLNVVGGVIGIVNDDTDIVNLTNSISVKANYYSSYNPFDYSLPYTLKQSNFEEFVGKAVLYEPEKNNITQVSYAGGIVGICNITKRDPEEVEDETLSTLYNNLYRARRLYLSGVPTIEGEVAGGIFGYLSESSNLSDCDVTVKQGMHIKSTRLAGGLIGHNLGEVKRCTIANENQEEIDTLIKRNPKQYDNAKTDIALGVEDLFGADSTEYRAMFVGGLIGFMQRGTILNCYNRVTVASKNSLYAGGLVGIALGGTSLDTCYVTGSVQAYLGIGGVIGYVADTIGGEDEGDQLNKKNPLFFETVCDGKENAEKRRLSEQMEILTVNLTNIVASNIWKFSHLDVSRRNSVSPNATSAYLGALAGKTYSILCRISSGDANEKFTNDKIQEKATSIYFSASTKAAIGNRAKTERIYYKQTYTYVSLALNQSQKALINEVGSSTYKLYSDKEAGMFQGVAEEDKFSELYGAYSENLKMYKSEDLANTETHTVKPFFYNESNGIMSGLFRYSTTENDADYNKLYIVSRAQSYGSLRSLSEFVARKSDIVSADALYKDLGIEDNETKLKRILTDSNNKKFFDFIDKNGEKKRTAITDTANLPIYQNTWEERVWKGIQLKEDMSTLIDEECVFPALKNSVDTWTDVFVYSETDLQKLNRRTTSNFILMNDIYLSEGADNGNFCSTKPFRGTIRSAKVGDVDGTNIVTQNFTFTIFNLNIKPSLSSGNGLNAIGGLISTAIGATFENFNLHVIEIDSSTASFGYDTKTNAMGVLVGRANSSTTIKNVQILGGKHTVDSNLTNVYKGTWQGTGLNLTSVATNYIPYALSASGYIKGEKSVFSTKNEDGSTYYAGVKGINIEFMGGYVGVATDMVYTGTNVKNSYTGSLNIFDFYDTTLVKGLKKSEDGKSYFVTTFANDRDDEIDNEYVGSCQIKNIRFENKYYGTTHNGEDFTLGGNTPSVLSYMGGYFGLATVNGFTETDLDKANKKVNFKTTNIDFKYDLYLTNKIDGNELDKFIYDPSKVSTGVYIGVVAGQIKTYESGDTSTVLVENLNVENSNISVTLETDPTLVSSKKYSLDTVAVGAFGKLDSTLIFRGINVANVDIDYNNGYTIIKEDGAEEQHFGVAVNDPVGTGVKTGIKEYIGGFAGFLSDSVELREIEEIKTENNSTTYTYRTTIYNTKVDYTGLFDSGAGSVSGHEVYIGGAVGKSKLNLQANSTALDNNISFNSNMDYDVYIGGFMGSYDGITKEISTIYASGNIKYTQNNSQALTSSVIKGEHGRFIGGLIGKINYSSSTDFLSLSSTGANVNIDIILNQDVSNSAMYAGGLVGFAKRTQVSYSYSSGDILFYFDYETDLDTNLNMTKYNVGELLGCVSSDVVNQKLPMIYNDYALGSIQITANGTNMKSKVYDLMKNRYTGSISNSDPNFGGIIGNRDIYITGVSNESLLYSDYVRQITMLGIKDDGINAYASVPMGLVKTNTILLDSENNDVSYKLPIHISTRVGDKKGWLNTYNLTYAGSKSNPISHSRLAYYIIERTGTTNLVSYNGGLYPVKDYLVDNKHVKTCVINGKEYFVEEYIENNKTQYRVVDKNGTPLKIETVWPIEDNSNANAEKWLKQIVDTHPYDEKLAYVYEYFRVKEVVDGVEQYVISNEELTTTIMPYIEAITSGYYEDDEKTPISDYGIEGFGDGKTNQITVSKFANMTISNIKFTKDFEFSNCIVVGCSARGSANNIILKDATMVVDFDATGSKERTVYVSVDSVMLNAKMSKVKNEGLILYSEIQGYGIGRTAYEEVRTVETTTEDGVEYNYTTSRSTAFIAESEIPYPTDEEDKIVDSTLPSAGGNKVNNLPVYENATVERSKYLYGNLRNCVAIQRKEIDGKLVDTGNYYVYGEEANKPKFGYWTKEHKTTYKMYEIMFGVVEENFVDANDSMGRRKVTNKEKPIVQTYSEDYSYYHYDDIFTTIDNTIRVQGQLRDSWSDSTLGMEYNWQKNFDTNDRVLTSDSKGSIDPDGTYYFIKTKRQFLYMINQINLGAVRSNYHVVIDTSDKEWDFSGKIFIPFKYVDISIDFGGVKLKGLNIVGDSYAGLITRLGYNAESISNVYIADSYILGVYGAGGLIGWVDASPEIKREQTDSHYTYFFENPVVINKVGIEDTMIFAGGPNGNTVGSLICMALVSSSDVETFSKRYPIPDYLKNSNLRLSIVFTGGINDIYTTTYQKAYNGSYLLVGDGFGSTPKFINNELTTSLSGKYPTSVGYLSNFKNVYMAPISYDVERENRTLCDQKDMKCYLASYGMGTYKLFNRVRKRYHYLFGDTEKFRPAYDEGTTISEVWTYYSINKENANNYRYKNNIKQSEVTAEQIRVEENLPTFRFDSIDWKFDYEIEKDFYNINYNFGLPRLIYDTQYWVDHASKVAPSYSSGYYIITNAEELAWFAREVNENGRINISARVTNNINLAGKVWTPIGTKDRPFMGIFNGFFNTISNISSFGYYSYKGAGHTTNYSGLFGNVKNATIRSITIDKGRIEGENNTTKQITDYYVGSVVAYAKNSTISGIQVKNVNILNSYGSIGGIIGCADYDTRVEACYFGLNDSERACEIKTVKVAVASYIGGIAGSVRNSRIISCKVSNAKIILDNSNYIVSSSDEITGGIIAGGIVGLIQERSQTEIGNEIKTNDKLKTVNNTLLQDNYYRGFIEWKNELKDKKTPHTIGMIVGYINTKDAVETYTIKTDNQDNYTFEYNGRQYHIKNSEYDGILYTDTSAEWPALDVDYSVGTTAVEIRPIVNIFETVVEFRSTKLLEKTGFFVIRYNPRYSLIGKDINSAKEKNIANYFSNVRIENVFLYLKYTGDTDSNKNYIRYNFSDDIKSTSALGYLKFVKGWGYTESYSNDIVSDDIYKNTWSINYNHNDYVQKTKMNFNGKLVYIDGDEVKDASGSSLSLEGYSSIPINDYYGSSCGAGKCYTWWHSYEVGLYGKKVTIGSVTKHNDIAINAIYRHSSNRMYSITYTGMKMDTSTYTDLYAIGNSTYQFGLVKHVGKNSEGKDVETEITDIPIVIKCSDGATIELLDSIFVKASNGLFGYVKNVKFKDMNITMGHYTFDKAPTYEAQRSIAVLTKNAHKTSFTNCNIKLIDDIYLGGGNSSNTTYIGFIVGNYKATSTHYDISMENCHVTGDLDKDIYIIQSNCVVGGLAGYVYYSDLGRYNYFTNCSITNVSIVSKNPYTDTNTSSVNFGGIVGLIENGGNYENRVENCTATSLYVNVDNDSFVGGIVGRSKATIYTGNMLDLSKIVANNNVGGIVGIAETGRLGAQNKDNANQGNTVTESKITGKNHVGGIAGSFNTLAMAGNTMEIIHNKNDATINGMTSVGGIIGYLENNSTSSLTVQLAVSKNINRGTINTIELELGDSINLTSSANKINNFRNNSKNVGGIIGELYTATYTQYSAGGGSSSGPGGGNRPGDIHFVEIYSSLNAYAVKSKVPAYIEGNDSYGNISGYENVGGIVGKQYGNFITYDTNNVRDCMISGMNGVAGIAGRIELRTTSSLSEDYKTDFKNNSVGYYKLGETSQPVKFFANTSYAYTTVEYGDKNVSIVNYSSYIGNINSTSNTDAFTMVSVDSQGSSKTYVDINYRSAYYTQESDSRKFVSISNRYQADDMTGFQLHKDTPYYLNKDGTTFITVPIFVEGKCYMYETSFACDRDDNSEWVIGSSYERVLYSYNLDSDNVDTFSVNIYKPTVTTTTNFNNSGSSYYYEIQKEALDVGYYGYYDNRGRLVKSLNQIVVTPNGATYLYETSPVKRWVALEYDGKVSDYEYVYKDYPDYGNYYMYSIRSMYSLGWVFINKNGSQINVVRILDDKVADSYSLSLLKFMEYGKKEPIADIYYNKDDTLFTISGHGSELYTHYYFEEDCWHYNEIFLMKLMFITIYHDDFNKIVSDFYFSNTYNIDTDYKNIVWGEMSEYPNSVSGSVVSSSLSLKILHNGIEHIDTDGDGRKDYNAYSITYDYEHSRMFKPGSYYNSFSATVTRSLYPSGTITSKVVITALDPYGDKVYIVDTTNGNRVEGEASLMSPDINSHNRYVKQGTFTFNYGTEKKPNYITSWYEVYTYYFNYTKYTIIYKKGSGERRIYKQNFDDYVIAR